MKLKCQQAEEKAQLQQRIDKNRDQIDLILHQDWPLELVYIRVNMLSAQNERLIAKLNNL